MNTPVVRLLSIAALCWGTVQAQCTVGSTVDLRPYAALQLTRSNGVLTVNVRCAHPEDAYQLHLLAGDQTVEAQGQGLRLTTRNSKQEPLFLELPTASASFGGLVFTGSRTFSFPISIDTGQWVSAGSYTARLQVVIQAAPTGQASALLPFAGLPFTVPLERDLWK